MITEISDAVGESGRGFGRITASEVFRAEVLVASTITQHVIDAQVPPTLLAIADVIIPP
jgi:hypothetical protein